MEIRYVLTDKYIDYVTGNSKHMFWINRPLKHLFKIYVPIHNANNGTESKNGDEVFINMDKWID